AGAAADWKTMKKGRNVGDLRRHQHERLHAFVGTSTEDDGANALALVVEENRVGAHQVGAAIVAAARIRSVTERAVDGEERFAAFHRRRITDRTLRVRDEAALAALGRRRPAPARRTPSVLARGLRRYDAEPQRDAAQHIPV